MKVASKETTSPINPDPPIRIIKTATCQSISGKSTLTYNIGCTPKSNVSICILSNTGGGYFSNEWVSLNAIQHALEKSNKQITSTILQPLFRGKSANTPAFLLAVLKHEGLVQLSKDKLRFHEYVGSDKFMDEVKKLIGLKSVSTKQTASKKPTSSNKSTDQRS